jgi:hypothetical protein
MERLGYFKFDGHGVLFRCTALQWFIYLITYILVIVFYD